jgi:hypothetical protein
MPTTVPLPEQGLGGASLTDFVGLIGQQQALWCWAACFQMVFYQTETVGGIVQPKYPHLKKEQCELVQDALQILNCCANPAICNQTLATSKITSKWLEDGFPVVYEVGPVSWDVLRAETDNARPVEIGIKFPGPGGHAILAVQCSESDGDRNVLIYNPLPVGTGEMANMTYEHLLNGYCNAQWKWTWHSLSRVSNIEGVLA